MSPGGKTNSAEARTSGTPEWLESMRSLTELGGSLVGGLSSPHGLLHMAAWATSWHGSWAPRQSIPKAGNWQPPS